MFKSILTIITAGVAFIIAYTISAALSLMPLALIVLFVLWLIGVI